MDTMFMYFIGWGVASILLFIIAVKSGKITLGSIFLSVFVGAFSWLLVLGMIGVLFTDILGKYGDKEIVLWRSKNYKPTDDDDELPEHSIDDAGDHGYD